MNESSLCIPISISLYAVRHLVNAKMPDPLYDNTGAEGNDQGLRLFVQRIRQVELRLEGQSIRYRIPLRVEVEKDLRVTKAQAESELFLDLKTTFQINSDWSISTQTDLEYYEWIIPPAIKVGFVDLSLGFIADQVIKRTKEKIGETIDQQVAEKLDLPQIIKENWEKARPPVLVAEDYQAWLRANPKRLKMAPFETSQGMIHTAIAIDLISDVKIGPQPPSILGEQAPVLEIVPVEEASFDLNTSAEITYEQAERLAKDRLVGETFVQKGQTVRIEDLTLNGKGSRIHIQAVVSGSFSGSVDFEGTPIYYAPKKEIRLDDIELDIQANNVLFRGLIWLFKGLIVSKVQENLQFSLAEPLEQAQIQIAEKLENLEPKPGVKVQGKLEHLDVTKLELTDTGMQVFISAQGAMQVDIQQIPMD